MMWMSSSDRSGRSRARRRRRRERLLVVGELEPVGRRAAARPPRSRRGAASGGRSRIAAIRGANSCCDDRAPTRSALSQRYSQLGLDVPVVDVHRDGADLVDGEHRLDPLRRRCTRRCPTWSPGADPRAAARWCAIRFDRSSSSAYVRRLSPTMTPRCGPGRGRRSPRTCPRSCSALPSTRLEHPTLPSISMRAARSRSSPTTSGPSTPPTQPMSDDSHTWLSTRATARSRSVGCAAVHRARDDRGHRLADPGHGVGFLRAAPIRAPAPSPRSPPAAGLEHACRPPQHVDDPVGRARPPSAVVRRSPAPERLDLLEVRLEQQPLLAREVAVDGPERDAGLGRDVTHLHRVEATLVRQRQRRVEHPPPPGRLVARQRSIGARRCVTAE